ncbi:Cdc6/Cdc18 family protein [Natrarchaeobaculum sulfurireducens]|uniref:Cdc6-related protein, AAA superfamily ATPase n=1 Tax=Natrarchaeobaculum sulfurireducens TaxID=2044521 RepID=A0A346PI79_9EURY|nr:Cdc6/Cdc18 family protein [Natrarchaeobaculum sulfurireducens]AXR79224.1 Cdc6-related protein, AAA superfamily ATPase [Natrarchaeobaculum sulfurireducens]
MITDARALQRSFVPQELQHRDGQISYLSAALKPITQNSPGEHVFIHGPSGAGKTTLARHVAERLEATAFGFRWGYVNCMSDSSTNAVLQRLVRDTGLAAHLSTDGTPASEFYDQFRTYDGQLLVILDEVDCLEDESVLHALYDMPNVTMVVITIGEDNMLARCDSRVRSRLQSMTTVALEKYTLAQLVDILRARIRAGLAPGVITSAAIAEIADRAAGDAREAIAMLRQAVMVVDSSPEPKITVGVVHRVEDDAREEIRCDRVDDLGTHKRLLYDIIDAAGKIGVTELRETYEQRCSVPKAGSTRRRYLASLEEKYELIASSGNG